jgi:hypothetical protein
VCPIMDLYKELLLRLILLLCCLLVTTAVQAAPILVGTIASSGISKNNKTTAVPFTIPTGPTSIQCNADVYMSVDYSPTGVVTSSTGMKVYAWVEKPMVMVSSRPVLVVLPVSGAAICNVWQLSGETVSYRTSPGSGGITTLTSTDVQASILGKPLSISKLVVTESDNTKDAILLNGGRIRAVSSTVFSGGYFYYNLTTNRWTFGHAIENCGGCSLLTDSLLTQQGDRPVAIAQNHGMRLEPQTAGTLRTCGTTPGAPEGTELTLSSASVSGPSRRCYCSVNSGTGTWINLTCPSVSGSSSVCPACS